MLGEPRVVVLRRRGMRRLLVPVSLGVALLEVGCTSQGQPPQPTAAAGTRASATASPSSTVSPLFSPLSVARCAKTYPTVRLAATAVAGDLRWFGPHVAGGPVNFPELADAAVVTLCLVPAGQGSFSVYGLPVPPGRSGLLWQQNVQRHFDAPG